MSSSQDKPPDLPNRAKLVLFLLFNPRRFEKETDAYAEKLLERQHEHERLRKEGRDDPEPWSAKQTRIVRESLGVSFLLVVLVVVLAAALGLGLDHLVGPPSQDTARGILYSGIGLLLWATLGKGGWSIQTHDGETLPEQLDQFIFRVLHLFGSFLLVLSGTWQGSYFS